MYLIFRTFESQKKHLPRNGEWESKKENEKNIDGFFWFCYIVRTDSIIEWIFCRSSSTWPIKWRSINWTLLWKWFFVGQRSPLKSLSNLSIENYEYILMALNKSFFFLLLLSSSSYSSSSSLLYAWCFFCFCVFELWFSFWKFVVQMMKQELLLNIQQRMHLCAHLMNWFIASGLHLYECYDLCICVLNCGSASPILQKPIENDYIY